MTTRVLTGKLDLSSSIHPQETCRSAATYCYKVLESINNPTIDTQENTIQSHSQSHSPDHNIIQRTRFKRYTVNKAPFALAKTKENFELIKIHQTINIYNTHQDTITAYTNYLVNTLPHGFDLKLTRYDFQKLV
jgi:ribosomal protein S10